MGFYISGHPLEPYRTEVEVFASHTVSQLGAWTDQPISLGVVVTAIKRQISKRSGAEFARLSIEDFSGSTEVMIFPEAWTVLAERVKSDVPVLLKGGYSRRDQGAENPTFIVESLTPFAELRATGTVAVQLELALGALTADALRDVREIVDMFPGSSPLHVRWSDGNGQSAVFRSRSLKVDLTSNAALSALRRVLGEDRVKIVPLGKAA
jgi:DNA polymerase-3 subunit alpha